MTLKILVIGGSGVFGGRLVNGILATSTLEIVIAGRHSERCRDFIATHDAADQARLSTAIIDTGRVTAADLLATGAAVVVDTTGPFQGHDFRVARAAIEAGIHYVDLADARDFVGDIAVLDQAARSAGVAILSGASSTPSLSNAVLDALVTGWRQVDHVRVVISPGNRTPRGLAVVRSILSYAGRPVRVFLGGTWRSVPGWGLTRRLRTISLGRRWVALCETPDLDIIPARFRVQRSAVFQAGLELGILHLGLLAASLLVRMRVLRSLAPFATIVRALATLFERAGTDRGVMLVEAAGLDRHGRCARAAWTLIADAGDGLNVPTIPALVVVRALAAGRLTWRGAGPCVGIVPLEDLEVEFLRFHITTQRTASQPGGPALFRSALGPHFDRLPQAVQAVHEPGWGMTLNGRARVIGPSNPLAAVVARALGFPPAADSVPLRVDIDVDDTGERWTRDFGGRSFVSRLTSAAASGHITERFGLVSFDVALSATATLLRWDVVSWRLGWLKLPRFLMPTASAEETRGDHASFCFDVTVRLPLGLGQVVRYVGSLSVRVGRPLKLTVA